MATKGYISNRFPYLVIGPKIHFKEGVFETDDESLQAIIESNEWYNLHIHPRDGEEQPTVAEAPRARHGGRGTR